jgi:beta-galactosidase
MKRHGNFGTGAKRLYRMKLNWRGLVVIIWIGVVPELMSAEKFVAQPSARVVLDFNRGWKFFKGDATNAAQVEFIDSDWADVSTPHTFNDVDTFDNIITRGGERDLFEGVTWYRKHFKLPAAARGGKVFIEFEGIRQAAWFFVNGRLAGKHENGVTPCGIDVTDMVKFGHENNVLAVKVNNRHDYTEETTGVPFQWNTRDFNPMYGGIVGNVRLHLTGRVYQTLPLYENLRTRGVYVYATNISVADNTATVTVESEVRNESGDQQSVELSVAIVDTDGNLCAQFKGETADMVDGEILTLLAQGTVKDLKLWSDRTPNLYDVYSILTVDGKVVDVVKTRTGFRKTAFKGGAGTGGVYINDSFVWLTGYAQRSTDEWAGLGGAYPDWLHDFDAQLIRASKANYIRWMHVAPRPANVRACDRFGIIQIVPAGDKEKDVAGRQWDQRIEVMRNTIIYFRNNPSILFWEAGNSGISAEHMKQMLELRKELDPHGGRAMGCRSLNDPATTPFAEYFGVMIGQDERTDRLTGPTNMFRAYSHERRDRAPIIETEDFRDEAARRFWDDYSPPHFGFKPGPNDTWKWNSETFCIAAAGRYHAYRAQVITNTDPNRAKWSGYASIIWSDSNSHGRQYDSEVCRVSGKVDAVRLPKQAFYVYRVMQSDTPDIHIIGHWNYPSNTVKTVYVAANHCDTVELFVNGKFIGKSNTPTNGYIYAFPEVKFSPGKILAVAKSKDKTVAQAEIETAGEPKKLKLTPIMSPEGFHADGADVALFDVEVVDAQGRRCPTDEGRVDFQLEGPAIWRGGYNSGRTNSINHLWLYTECGINRVAVRSTFQPGTVTLTARRNGLEPATASIVAQPVPVPAHFGD